MAGLWWIGAGAVVMAALMILYFVWWVVDQLTATNDGKEQKVVRKYSSYRKGHN